MKRLIPVLLLLLVSEKIFPQSIGPLNPSGAAYSAFGCLACPGGEWTDLNYLHDPDHQYVSVFLTAQPNCFQTVCYYSRILYAFDFGFTIPAGAVIKGVKAEMLRMASISLSIKDTMVKLYTGAPIGVNHADTTHWTTNPITITYGDSSDTWGYTLTPDSVNNSQFGFALQTVNENATGASVSASIDNVMMTVYYELGTGIYSQTRSNGKPEIRYDATTNSLEIISGKEKIHDISLMDVSGRKILEANSSAFTESGTVNLPSLSKGIYFALIQTNNSTFTEKIFVQE